MKKLFLFGLGILIATVCIIPIFVNLLMSFNIGVNVTKSNDWIGFHASYLGAIIGGMISGGLTLGGVWLTIEDQKSREAANTYPEKRLMGDEVVEALSIIDSFEDLLSEENGKIGSVKEKLMYIRDNQGNYLRSASKVSGEFYVTTREIIRISNRIIVDIETVINKNNMLMDNDYEEKRRAKISEIKKGSDLKELLEKKNELVSLFDKFISYHEKLIYKKKRSPIK